MAAELAPDVVVLGTGMAGMCAATAAVEQGAQVLVVERAPTIGGSAAISGGYVWTARDLDSLRNEDMGEFQRHGHLVVEGYEDVKRWLTGFASPVTQELPTLYGRGHKFDIPLLFGTMARRIVSAGGRIRVGAEVTDVARNDDGFTLSVRRNGDTSTVRSPSLVLATGGRQADPEVRRSLIEGGALLAPLRGNRFSRGDGAAIAIALGGRVNAANKGFYGHLFAAGVEPLAPIDFIIFSLFQSSEGVMLDAGGRRFADETRGDHNNAAAVAAIGGRALLLWSQEVQERVSTTPWTVGTPLMDRWLFSRDRGGRTTSAADAAELVRLVDEWGYDVQTALADGAVRARIGAARIFAAEVVPAVTMTFGGIEVDDVGAAVDGSGEPIPGLLVAGGDTSDIYHRGYAGGLCAAAVTGRRAGTTAARIAGTAADRMATRKRMSADVQADVVVLGAGLAGMSAATAASEHGARVLVLERAPAIGGSAAISGGYVWTANDLEGLRKEDSGEFQRHGHLVVEGYRDVTRWLSDMAAPLTKEQPNLHGRGHKFDIPLVQATMARRISAAGGTVRIDAEVTDVAGDGDGFTLAVRGEGSPSTVRTRSLVLATGGRQADPEVRRSLVEGGALVPPLRGNSFSRGDGAAIATALGGRVNTANEGFYGHLWALGVEPIAPFDFISFTFYQSEEGVMLDTSGRRFADETRGDHNNTTALAAHGGHALLLWSEEVQERAGGQPFVGGSLPMDRWGFSRDRGGRVTSAADVAELLPIVRGWGYDVDTGTFEDEGVHGRLGTGRIFAADVIPAVTMTFGGIEIDSSCRALDANGEPIAGLFAAGGDASDIYHRGYGGGLCAAAVTGRGAGTNAAELAKARA